MVGAGATGVRGSPIELDRLGVWSAQLRTVARSEAVDAAAELEELGYGAIWMPAFAPDDLEDRLRALLDGTRRIVVATGIVSVWTHAPTAIAAMRERLSAAHPGRFLLGLGVSHAPAVEQAGKTYRRPLAAMNEYLDRLDTADSPVPCSARVIGALAPRMLALARERAWGAHPYLVTPEHTARARELLGEAVLLAPEQKIVLEADPDHARAVVRKKIARNLRLPNYVASLTRMGFSGEDLEHGGSDRLVDGLVAWGPAETALERVRQHHAAGADHVAIQVVTDDDSRLPLAEWRQTAPALAR